MPNKPAASKDRTDWKQLLIGFALPVVVIVGGIYLLIHPDLVRLENRVNKVSSTLTKTDDAVKVIADRQGTDTKGLIDDILSSAKMQQDAGNPAAAARILDAVPGIISAQNNLSVPDVVLTAKRLRSFASVENEFISGAAVKGMAALATYRSTSTPVPENFHPRKTITRLFVGSMEIVNGQWHISDALLQGRALDNTGGNGFDIDNFVLKNVVLKDMAIIYRGGPVTLQKVHFVNCTFYVQKHPRVIEFLQSAIQDAGSFKVG